MNFSAKVFGKFTMMLSLALLASLLLASPTEAVSTRNSAYNPCKPRGGAFWPTEMNISGVGTVKVIGLRKARNGVPRTPAISNSGKRMVAWSSSHAAPGASRGNVLMNAHTYPDGSALGNQMLKSTGVGSLIMVSGPYGNMCYRVTKRVVYNPSGKKLAKQYYNQAGYNQLAIVVCSGKRIGKGRWTKRTVWYASPSLY